MLSIINIFILFNFLFLKAQYFEYPEPAEGYEHVVYNSLVKLANKKHKSYKLHSQNAKYGSGSGQQVVTASDEDVNNDHFWLIRPAFGVQADFQQPVKCGDVISIKHSNTQVYLHSHLHNSPLSNNQEVSGYENHDTGDNFIVECYEKDVYWKREMPVYLKHKDTGLYLKTSSKNKYGHPLAGNLEVFAQKKKSNEALWMTQDGIYLQKKAPQN